MIQILAELKTYARQTNKRAFALASLFMALAIFINYHYGLNTRITRLNPWLQFACWYALFLTVFFFGYAQLALFGRTPFFEQKRFWLLLLLAPALFAWKMAQRLHFPLSGDAGQNAYWNLVLYWPFKLAVLSAALFLLWRLLDSRQPFYGLSAHGFTPRPYVLMLLVMLPLVAVASTQPDFLAVYPKLAQVAFLNSDQSGWYKLLYELAYGSDFFTIELFFRGFLVLAFAKWAGKDAILPMALFYCTIHFGKPLGECISSFYGGLVLGVVTYHSRSIWGGLMVHLGIAWLMELGGYLGRLFL